MTRKRFDRIHYGRCKNSGRGGDGGVVVALVYSSQTTKEPPSCFMSCRVFRRVICVFVGNRGYS